MNNSTIAQLLSSDGYIQINKMLIKKLGLEVAVIIGELCAEYTYWDSRNKLVDGLFYSTQENIEKNTGLNAHYQRKAMKVLKDEGIITVIKKGLPAKNYYKIDFDKLCTVLNPSGGPDEGLETNEVNINKNKEKNINNNKTNSLELVEKTSSNNNSNNDFLGSAKKKSKGKNLYSKCIDMINDYTEDSEVRKLLVTYLGMRLEMKDKPIYSNQWKGLLNKLTQLVNDGNNMQDVIQQSINRGYAGFFPVYSGGNNNIQNAPCEQGVVSQKETEQEKRYNEECAKRREANGQQVYF